MTLNILTASQIKSWMILVAEKLHTKVFGHAMSGEMRKFLGNLSWSLGAGLLAAVIMFGVNIVAGRVLGPVEFGKYNLVLSLATALMFFFLLGNNQSSVRYLSDKAHERNQYHIVGSVIFLTFIQILIIFCLIFFLKDFVAEKLGVDAHVVYLALFFGLLLSLKDLSD
jgi:O-antigen/teichoic acid export membrane protein